MTQKEYWAALGLFGWEITWNKALWGVGLFLAAFSISLGVVIIILIKLPADYFCDPPPPSPFAQHHPFIRGSWLFGKNILGLALIILGILLSLPGIPGQGILTILIGLMLLNFPGKRAWERWLVSRRKVLAGVNKIRKHYGKGPLLLERGGHPDCPPANQCGNGKLMS